MSRWWLIIAAIATAAGFYFGGGLHPTWWLMWIAPMPLLVAATSAGGKPAFVAAFVAYFLGGLDMWRYLHGVLGLPAHVVILFTAGPALIFAADVLVSSRLLRAGRVWQGVLSFPALWVAYEYLQATVSPHSTFGNLAYTQMNFLWIIQIASVTGIWGISFVVLLFASTAAALLARSGIWRQRRWVAVASLVVLAAVAEYGRLHLFDMESGDHPINVALIAKDDATNIYRKDGLETLSLLRDYATQAQSTVTAHPDIIVLPEKIAVISDEHMSDVDSLFSSLANDTKAAIVVGVVERKPSIRYNESRLYLPGQTQPKVYLKHHLIPGIESESPGSERVAVSMPHGALGLEICKDMDFPALSREYGKAGVGLMLVPAWDFRLDGWLHGRMAVLRGVENGFFVVRSAKDGLLTVSDPEGRILGEKQSSDGFETLETWASFRQRATLYTRFGDWFAWLDLLLSAVVLGFVFTARKKSFQGFSSAAG